MSIFDVLFGSKDKMKKASVYTPEQEAYLRQFLGGLSGNIGGGFDYIRQILEDNPELMAQFERPALRQFNEEIIPGITERFTSELGPGSRSSSGFNQAMARASERLSENLAAQRAGMKQNAIQSLLAGSQMGFNARPFENYMQQGRQGIAGPILGGIAGGLGGGLGLAGGMGIYNRLFGGGGGSRGFSGINDFIEKSLNQRY